MRSMLLMEWIGGLEEDLLERSEQTAAKRMPRFAPWIATAACLCIVCTLALGIFGSGKKAATDNASGGVPEQENPIFGNGIVADSQTNSSLHDPEDGGFVTEPYGYPCQSQSYGALHGTQWLGPEETNVFFSRQELDAWLDTHRELEGADREQVLQMCQKYDAGYFASQALLLTRVGVRDGYCDYKAGHIYVGVSVESDWLLYLFETPQAGGTDAERCRYVFSEVDASCTIAPGDTVEAVIFAD